MSNYVSSTITIDRSKYNALMNQAQRVSALMTDNDNLRVVNASLDNQLRDAIARINAADQNFNEIWDAIAATNDANVAIDSALRSEIDDVYRDALARIHNLAGSTQQSIDDLRTEFGNAIANSIAANNQVISEAMNRNNQTLTEMIRNLRSDTENAIANMTAQLQNLHSGAAALLDSALEYMLQVRNLQDAISKTRHAQLLPGKYDNVLNAVNLAQSNISLAEKNPMNTSVARDKARAAFEESIRFLEEIAIAEQEWQAQLAIAQQILVTVSEQIENSRTIEPKPGAKLDVDYWSNNGISVNSSDFEKLRETLENPDSLTTEQLVDLQQALIEISRRVDSTVADAYVRSATSQNITRISERIHRELNATANLQVIDHSFEGGDKRGNYRYILQDKTGLTVVVTISVNEVNGELRIEPEADIVGYGSMPVQEAENLVRAAMERVSGSNSTSCTQTAGATVLHPERAHFDTWKRPHDVQHTPVLHTNDQ